MIYKKNSYKNICARFDVIIFYIWNINFKSQICIPYISVQKFGVVVCNTSFLLFNKASLQEGFHGCMPLRQQLYAEVSGNLELSGETRKIQDNRSLT